MGEGEEDGRDGGEGELYLRGWGVFLIEGLWFVEAGCGWATVYIIESFKVT